MKAAVVYDSVFGNTEKVAQSIGTALAETGDVEIVRVGEMSLEQLSNLDLLVVGSPTRGFKATEPTRKFLGSIPPHRLDGVRVAAFDTRMDVVQVDSRLLTFMVKIFGYAAEPIAKELVKKGGVSAAAAAGFIVTASEGPLREGELERAAAWARGLSGG